ncbi:ferritin-like domain-containing protein [Halorientalis halophila]|uniref:YciE/YciF ferroxidase family protein n=1 Tax=Halorientalis halophila TaxID=3108499 RepID=UPI0030093CFB
MTTDSIEALMRQGLQELYYAEGQFADALDTLADQTTDDAASQAFSDHREETEEQLRRLEQVFEAMGEDPQPMEDAAVKAMIDEHEQFAGENEGDVLDRYNMELGQKVEHYEIAAYGSLASQAEKIGHDEAADHLTETLREEEAALETITEASEQFDEQMIAGD